MQKDYSGILLCTDYDGTLSYGGVCRENIDAINDFMAHGGRFTLATGRGTYELREGDLPVTPNAPLVLMIGAQIYDPESRCCLWEKTLPAAVIPTVAKIAETFAPIIDHVALYRSDRVVPFGVSSSEEIAAGLTHFNDCVCKVVYFLNKNFEPQEFAAAAALCGDEYNFCTNRTDNFEITAFGVHKGAATLYLKEYVGAHTLVCAGDLNGDISMIRAADIGYAVANATEETKAAADRITVHARDGAIARIIEDLGNR